MLKESSNPEQRSLADVVEALTELRGAVISIDKRMNNPDGLIPPDFFDRFYNRMRKMMGPDFMMYSKEMRFELREILDRLQKFLASSKRTEKETVELQFILERLERMSMYFEEIYMRTAKGLF
jgi:hypothetical protein